jgi:hypothetical protein
VHQLLVTACVVPSSPILVKLMKEVLSSFETSVLTKEPHGVTSQKTQFWISLTKYMDTWRALVNMVMNV